MEYKQFIIIHLGSLQYVLDASGNILEEYSFDAWGRRRNPVTWKYQNVPDPVYFSRGYTGHEHLEMFGLINMNGRIYDPVLCRFLSPDNYVASPFHSQSYNRYSYALNNPLIYTDPSGEIAWFVPVIIGAAIGGFSGYMIGDAAGAEGWDMAGYIAGGALIGGLSGGAASGISAAGGGAMLAGAGAGAVGGAGFSGLSTGWDGQAMLKGAAFGAISGFVGGGVGSAIGGGWGALAGGASANLTGQLLYNGGDFNSVNWGSVAGSGALSLGMYHGISYASWKWGGGDNLGGLDVTYRQYCKINAAYQRSRFWQKEYGVYLNSDGSARFTPANDRHKFDVVFDDWQRGDYATAHTHWAKAGVDWVDIGGTNNNWARYDASATYPAGSYRVTTVGGYHSPGDYSIPNTSLVVGRTTSTYSYYGTNSHSFITPDPFVRFFMFPWNW